MASKCNSQTILVKCTLPGLGTVKLLTLQLSHLNSSVIYSTFYFCTRIPNRIFNAIMWVQRVKQRGTEVLLILVWTFQNDWSETEPYVKQPKGEGSTTCLCNMSNTFATWGEKRDRYGNQPCLVIICRLTWRILLRTAWHTGHWVFPLWTLLCSHSELRFWNTLPQMVHCRRSLTWWPLCGPPTHCCWGSTNRQKGADLISRIKLCTFPLKLNLTQIQNYT